MTFWIERRERRGMTADGEEDQLLAAEYLIFEEGYEWPDGSPRDRLKVEFRPPWRPGKEPEVSWSATSDKRPEVAYQVARALMLATAEATGSELRGEAGWPACGVRPTRFEIERAVAAREEAQGDGARAA